MLRVPGCGLLLLSGLALAALSCNLGAAGATEIPEGQAETSIALTVDARLAQTSAAEPGLQTEVDTEAAPTATSDPPTETPEPTVAATATPSVPNVSVSVNTNCRTGPGRAYDYRGALLIGETEEVVARSTVPDYWYITNPDRPGEFCYLWGRYATVSGNTEALPELTPLPSPTATNTPTPSDTPTPTSTYTPIP